MTALMQPLRDEHKELYPSVEKLRLAADAVHEKMSAAERNLVEQAYDFLAYHLLPHAQAEEKALYPVVQKVMGAPAATATMSRDHAAVDQLVGDLRTLRGHIAGRDLTAEDVKELRRVLYGLYTLVKVHFAKEEEVYLPLLEERLTAAEAKSMFANMEDAAQQAKAQHSA